MREEWKGQFGSTTPPLESVVTLTGVVVKRPEGQVQSGQKSGEIEEWRNFALGEALRARLRLIRSRFSIPQSISLSRTIMISLTWEKTLSCSIVTYIFGLLLSLLSSRSHKQTSWTSTKHSPPLATVENHARPFSFSCLYRNRNSYSFQINSGRSARISRSYSNQGQVLLVTAVSSAVQAIADGFWIWEVLPTGSLLSRWEWTKWSSTWVHAGTWRNDLSSSLVDEQIDLEMAFATQEGIQTLIEGLLVKVLRFFQDFYA